MIQKKKEKKLGKKKLPNNNWNVKPKTYIILRKIFCTRSMCSISMWNKRGKKKLKKKTKNSQRSLSFLCRRHTIPKFKWNGSNDPQEFKNRNQSHDFDFYLPCSGCWSFDLWWIDMSYVWHSNLTCVSFSSSNHFEQSQVIHLCIRNEIVYCRRSRNETTSHLWCGSVVRFCLFYLFFSSLSMCVCWRRMTCYHVICNLNWFFLFHFDSLKYRLHWLWTARFFFSFFSFSHSTRVKFEFRWQTPIISTITYYISMECVLPN